MDNCWISCQVMADMKKVYNDLIVINLWHGVHWTPWILRLRVAVGSLKYFCTSFETESLSILVISSFLLSEKISKITYIPFTNKKYPTKLFTLIQDSKFTRQADDNFTGLAIMMRHRASVYPNPNLTNEIGNQQNPVSLYYFTVKGSIVHFLNTSNVWN